MDQLHTMRVFVSVVENSGFAGAARALGISPAAVTRAVSALEAHLQARLLTRSTRHVSLTDAGARYVEDCRRILADIEEADAHAKGLFSDPRGLLTVTAPSLFGRIYVTPIILEYLDRYPEAEARSVFVDRKVNILEEGVDAAIRIGALADSSLHATRVGAVRQVICASPDYLASAGTPHTPGDLRDHRLVSSGQAWNDGGWRFDGAAGGPIRPRFVTGSNDAAIAAAVAGWGLTRVLSYQVADEIAAGRLVPVLTGEETEVPIHVVHVEGRRASAKVRAFVDLAVQRLRADQRLR